MLLGDFGADVVKIEHPTRPDPARGHGALRGRYAAQEQAELGVLARRRPGQQREILEHHAALAAAGPGDRVAADQDAPAIGGEEAGNGFKQGGLAAAARPDQAQELARLDRDVDADERLHRTEVLRYALDRDADGCRHQARHLRSRVSARASA